MVHSVRHWTSFFVGLVILCFGLFHLIGKKAWLGPVGGLTGTILAYILAIGGLYVIIDAFFEFSFHSGIGIATLIIGLLFFGLGIINVLASFGVITFSVPIATMIYNILFVVEGVFLMIACFVMD